MTTMQEDSPRILHGEMPADGGGATAGTSPFSPATLGRPWVFVKALHAAALTRFLFNGAVIYPVS
jgi:hypothetical protein